MCAYAGKSKINGENNLNERVIVPTVLLYGTKIVTSETVCEG